MSGSRRSAPSPGVPLEPAPPRPRSYVPITIADGIRSSALRAPGKIALTEGGRSLSYAELVGRIARVSNLATAGLGLRKGEHAALMAPSCLEFMELVCGLADAGVPPAIVNARLTAAELAYICADSEARVLFVHPTLEELARSAELPSVERIVVLGAEYEALLGRARPVRADVRVEEWDPFVLAYTSGTTGFPKGALLPHRSRTLTCLAMAAEYGCYTARDRALAVSPLYHGGGFLFALAPVFFGGSCEILPKFDPEQVLALLAERHITNTFLVPTHFQALLQLRESTRARSRPPALRTVISNAAPLPQSTKERVVAWLGEGVLHELYGSTEGCIVTNLRPEDQLRKKQCAGLPFPCTELCLLDDGGQDVRAGEVGELYSRSPYLFNGYWRQPEKTAAAFRGGWFSAGDMAWQDDEGYVYIVDRKTDMILSGGVNIYPREVEEALQRHPAVADAAVIGVPDAYWGEAVRAFVVLRPDASVTESTLREFCAAALARFKLPKAIAFVPELPRNPAGKVLRRELRARLAAEAEASP
jgi:long-chain acyl-CoA synthetase